MVSHGKLSFLFFSIAQALYQSYCALSDLDIEEMTDLMALKFEFYSQRNWFQCSEILKDHRTRSNQLLMLAW